MCRHMHYHLYITTYPELTLNSELEQLALTHLALQHSEVHMPY